MYQFPFGSVVRRVEQTDRTPKRVFVLGVYASAVHATWRIGKRTVIRALAVASEPSIFWRGEGADEIVKRITVPDGMGILQAADAMNGPSGKALDELYLRPLGLLDGDGALPRRRAWLCDLLPEARLNSKQHEALHRDNSYQDYVAAKRVEPVTLPAVPSPLADAQRLAAIADELAESQAEILITLGEPVVAEFLHGHLGMKERKLGDFGRTDDAYGRIHRVPFRQRTIAVVPLTHPRQSAGLGSSSMEWKQRHDFWVKRVAPTVLHHA